MEKQHYAEKPLSIDSGFTSKKLARRSFLQYTGAGVAAATLVMAGCKEDGNLNTILDADGIDLGSGDIGILNYAYALEQLEAAFYLQVVATPYKDISAAEKAYFIDISRHEVAHREFFKNALGAKAIPALEVDFSSIDFTSRDSVLGTAKAFEDLGVSAYNGAGQLLQSADYLLLAGNSQYFGRAANNIQSVGVNYFHIGKGSALNQVTDRGGMPGLYRHDFTGK
jgi:hypothetical protein